MGHVLPVSAVQLFELYLQAHDPLAVVVGFHALSVMSHLLVTVSLEPLRERNHRRLELLVRKVLS